MPDPQIKISYANSCSEEKWNKIFGKKDDKEEQMVKDISEAIKNSEDERIIEELEKKYLCHEYGQWCDLDNKEHIGAMCAHCNIEEE